VQPGLLVLAEVGHHLLQPLLGVLELHLWGSRVDDVEKPDRMVFDLDPDEGLDFVHVKEAAKELKERLADVGLKSFPMVTGGKGVHVVVPLQRRHTWDQHREFSEAMARLMAEEKPDRYIANMSKAKRRGKIFIDYLRNQRSSTAIAPYSTRARAGAFVALPLTWEALARAAASRGERPLRRLITLCFRTAETRDIAAVSSLAKAGFPACSANGPQIAGNRLRHQDKPPRGSCGFLGWPKSGTSGPVKLLF